MSTPTDADPLAHAKIPSIPLTPTIFLVLFCLSIILFIRITHFTLSKNNEYSITRGLEEQQQGQPESFVRPNRQMATSLAYVGFHTVSSPRSSLYVPNLIFGNNTHVHLGAPLLVQRDTESEPVELDTAIAVEADEEWEENMCLHGTNTLNTPWSWMA